MSGVPRHMLVMMLVAAVAGPAAAQDGGPGMVGPPSASRDFTGDRGLLIAKGTTLPRGAGYVYALGLPLSVGVAYGITDRLTVHAGTSAWILANGLPGGYVSARFGVVRTPVLGVAVGATGVAITDGDATTAAGWPYLTATAGTDRVALSGLVGVGSSTEVFESDFNGDVLVQGLVEVAVTADIKLLAEALYLGEDSDPVGGVGVRWSGARIAVEAGAVRVFEPAGSSVEILPWVGVAIRFK